MKRNFLPHIFEIYCLKYSIPQFEMFRVKRSYKPSKLCYFALKKNNGIRIARPKYNVTRAADVVLVPEDEFSMAESKAGKRQRGRYCVAGAPNHCQSLVLPIIVIVRLNYAIIIRVLLSCEHSHN